MLDVVLCVLLVVGLIGCVVAMAIDVANRRE
jgi:Tfp pilus assembly protein PilX